MTNDKREKLKELLKQLKSLNEENEKTAKIGLTLILAAFILYGMIGLDAQKKINEIAISLPFFIFLAIALFVFVSFTVGKKLYKIDLINNKIRELYPNINKRDKQDVFLNILMLFLYLLMAIVVVFIREFPYEQYLQIPYRLIYFFGWSLIIFFFYLFWRIRKYLIKKKFRKYEQLIRS
jgi:undecaprenyl pyrophosphate phosphatase UppP